MKSGWSTGEDRYYYLSKPDSHRGTIKETWIGGRWRINIFRRRQETLVKSATVLLSYSADPMNIFITRTTDSVGLNTHQVHQKIPCTNVSQARSCDFLFNGA